MERIEVGLWLLETKESMVPKLMNNKSPEAPITGESLRQWCKSVGPEVCSDALLTLFRQARSRERRAELWDALLETLSLDEEAGLLRTLYMKWADELLKALIEADPHLRCQGLSALADIAPYVSDREDIIVGLIRGLYDKSELVRSRAISTVRRFSNRSLLLTLIDSITSVDYMGLMFDDPQEGRLWTPLFALDEVVDTVNLTSEEQSKIAGTMLDALNITLNEPYTSDLDIWKIGDTLGEHIKGDPALGVLKKMIAHRDPRVRISAVHGLSHLGGKEAAVLIKQALSDPAAMVREEAKKGLLTIQ